MGILYMTTATLTKLRRDTNSNLASATPAEGEPAWNLTTSRLSVGDGLRLGGIALPNAADIQNQTLTFPTVGGTGDAITLTNAIRVLAWTAGLSFEFKATADNTGAMTVAVDSLVGTK